MHNWLVAVVGETAAPIVGFILLFALVIVLLLLVFAVLRRVTGGTFVVTPGLVVIVDNDTP